MCLRRGICKIADFLFFKWQNAFRILTEADKIVEALRQCPYSKDAAIIGEVTADQPGKVVMTTEIGTQALLPQPGGELLPRIC